MGDVEKIASVSSRRDSRDDVDKDYWFGGSRYQWGGVGREGRACFVDIAMSAAWCDLTSSYEVYLILTHGYLQKFCYYHELPKIVE